MKYTGFNPELERKHQSPEDWVFGATSKPCIALIPESEREKYLPIGEVQAGKQDTGDCATRAPTNILEAKFNYLYRNNKLRPENKKWLEDNGYIQGYSVTFSDAFNAILSDTQRTGNSLKAPLESIRKNGLIPNRMIPLGKEMMWEEYHDPKRITQEMRNLGQEFLRRFTINYEICKDDKFIELLKTDIIDVAAHAWPVMVNGVYPKTAGDFNHAFILFNLPAYQAFDSYEEKPSDYTKNLAPDYVFWDTGYRVYISAETTPEDREIQKTVFDTLSKFGLLSFFADWWDRFTETVRGIFGDREFGAERSAAWADLSRDFIIANGSVCEMGLHKPTLLNPLNTHHIAPYHERPDLELKPSNWIVLCRLHHFVHGHFKNWASSNPRILEDADELNSRIKNRP